MNSLQRVRAVLEGDSYDAFPCIPLVFGYAASRGGLNLKKYLQKGEYLAQCQMDSQRKFGYDAVFVYGDNCLEAEAVGCKLHFPENAYPYIIKHVAEEFKQFKKLPLPNPRRDGRMPELLKAAKLLRCKVGDRLPIVGVVLGPMSIASQLMGLENLLYLLIDSPREFEYVLDYTSQISLIMGEALLEIGIHIPAVLDPSASQSVIPGDIFVQYLLPHLGNIFTGFKSAGAMACWLMITGNTRDILPYYPQCGTDLATIDYEVSLKEALSLAPELIIAGNIKPFSFVNKHSQEIAYQSKELLELATGSKGFVLSSGCEVPLDTKGENITAVVNAARGGYK